MSSDRSAPRAIRVAAHIVGFGMMVPLVLMILVALSGDSRLRVSASISFEWFVAFISDPGWRDALWVSLEVAVAVTALSVVLGVPMALGIVRSEGWVRRLAGLAVIGPIVVPGIAFAVGSYLAWTSLGFTDSKLALILASTALALPLVVINAAASATSISPDLERAAGGLGATRWQAMRLIVLPLMRRGIFAGALFAFISAWDELIVAIFLTSPRVTTFPVRMWEYMSNQITPIVPAAGTSLLLITLVALGLATILTRKGAMSKGGQ